MSRSCYLGGAVLLGALAVSCRKTPVEPPPCSSPSPSVRGGQGVRTPSPFDTIFAAAGAEFGVSPAVLRAIGWVETRWQMVAGAEEFPGRPAGFGVMALRGAALERGAALAGVTSEAARREPKANIRAAAALLSAYATESGMDSAIVRYSGIDVPAGRAAYQREIARAHGTVTPQAVLAACPPPADTGPDYAPAVWRPSPNFNARPSDSTGRIHMVIVHTCEGNYASCWSLLVNASSQVSAHYVVNEDGSEVSQLVRETDRAWHIAALYRCTLNLMHDCWLNDVQSNDFTVGIEHAGFASQDSFPATQLDASARLVCDVTRDRGIPRDWQHIVGHGQLQPENRTDPGPNWPWIAYIHRVQARCDEIVVDDSSRFNDAGVAMSVVPASWPTTQATPDYYGGGYRFASTQPDATDGAEFSFRLDAAGARTLDARWTSGTNRSPRAAYAVVAATADTLAVVTVDQTTGGGAWHALGTWTFPAGWSRVVLMRRDTAGTVVVADAVRVR